MTRDARSDPSTDGVRSVSVPPGRVPLGRVPLMLFAAGRGTRMRPLTEDRPKPMVEVAGRPLVDHALALADAAGIARRVANTHYLPETLTAHLGARGVAVSHEPDLLDTGGGLRAALPLLGPGPVLTLNADAVWAGPDPQPDPLGALIRAWRPGMGALLLLVPLARALGRAAPDDFALTPRGLARRGPLAYTGAQMIDPAVLDGIPGTVFSLNAAWDALAARGRLAGLVWDGAWCDVGTPRGIPLAEAMLEGRWPL